ncbi:MAG: spiro-SPASM protein [Spirochaetes bacterium]|jgi:spiro-SPASM protein|nr:spiro-SPASM protein [Spirochaetota bacterium]
MNNAFLLYLKDDLNDQDLLFNNSAIPAILQQKFEESFSGTPVIISVPSSYSGNLTTFENCFTRESNETTNWKNLNNRFEYDNYIRINADAPFADMTIIDEMLAVHTKYAAEYTYSENIPDGFCCDIISCELIKSLPEPEDEAKVLPVEKVIKDNINQFDVELFYKDPDIRPLRLAFLNGDERERIIMQNIFSAAAKIPLYSEIQQIINSSPQVLYTSPSYIEVEISPMVNSTTIYSAQQLTNPDRTEMSPELFDSILKGASSYNTPFALTLGGWGEPLKHSAFYSLFEKALKEPSISLLLLESDGIALDSNFIQFIQNHDVSKLRVIVECNGHSKETYTAIHGTDNFSVVEQNIVALQDILKDRLYIQIMKINETEPFLDSFYDFWETKNVQIILQKQNTYCGALEDRRYYDLTPLKRIPCWHLQRDLVILSNGDVPFCKQDPSAKFSSLSVRNMPIQEIWDERKPMFLENYANKFPSKPDCKTCDEWFTFNL